MDIKVGDKITLKANNGCYKSANRKDYYTLSEISKFYGEEKARLKKGRVCTVKAIDNVGGDVWYKIIVNNNPTYIVAYSKKKDKWYVK